MADVDKNGECTEAELAAVPGLRIKEAMADLDTNRNNCISQQEITEWLAALQQSKVAAAPSLVYITKRGEPVPGVRVQITPEPCMGDALKTAEGITDEAGFAVLRIPSLPLGAHFGIYRLHVTGNDATGAPIPSEYNSESTWGLIVPLVPRAPKFDMK